MKLRNARTIATMRRSARMLERRAKIGILFFFSFTSVYRLRGRRTMELSKRRIRLKLAYSELGMMY